DGPAPGETRAYSAAGLAGTWAATSIGAVDPLTGVRSLVVHLSCPPDILWLSDTHLVFSMRSGSRCTVARNPAWWERTPRFAAIAPGSGPILPWPRSSSVPTSGRADVR